MPTYDYRCRKCEHRFEEFQPINAEPKAKCPVCGAEAERQIGMGAGFIFKGSGFYTTDYRSESYKKAAESEKKSVKHSKDEKKEKDTKKVSSPDN